MSSLHLPPHTLSSSEQQYVDQLNTKDRALHELAVQKLGSSYFVKWTHGYKKWVKSQEPPKTASPVKSSP